MEQFQHTCNATCHDGWHGEVFWRAIHECSTSHAEYCETLANILSWYGITLDRASVREAPEARPNGHERGLDVPSRSLVPILPADRAYFALVHFPADAEIVPLEDAYDDM